MEGIQGSHSFPFVCAMYGRSGVGALCAETYGYVVISLRSCSPTQDIAEIEGIASCISIETRCVILDQGRRQRDCHQVGRVT